MDYGIKITKPGKDITSLLPQDYALWSKYRVMKTQLVGTAQYTFNSDTNSVDIDITHNLGERKVAWVSIDGPNTTWKTAGWWAYYYDRDGLNIDTALRWWTVHTYTNKISIHYREGATQGSGVNPTGEVWNFKYYIFDEESG